MNEPCGESREKDNPPTLVELRVWWQRQTSGKQSPVGLSDSTVVNAGGNAAGGMRVIDPSSLCLCGSTADLGCPGPDKHGSGRAAFLLRSRCLEQRDGVSGDLWPQDPPGSNPSSSSHSDAMGDRSSPSPYSWPWPPPTTPTLWLTVQGPGAFSSTPPSLSFHIWQMGITAVASPSLL